MPRKTVMWQPQNCLDKSPIAKHRARDGSKGKTLEICAHRRFSQETVNFFREPLESRLGSVPPQSVKPETFGSTLACCAGVCVDHVADLLKGKSYKTCGDWSSLQYG